MLVAPSAPARRPTWWRLEYEHGTIADHRLVDVDAFEDVG
jgi:hypothetical protein